MRGLRAATLTAVLAGQVSTAVAGVLSPGVLLAAVAVTVAGASAAGRIPAPRAGLLRNGATGAAAILAVATVPRLSSGPGTREVLGPLLVGIVALQAWTWCARSDLRTALLAAFGLLVLGASYAPDVLVGLPLLVGWAAALVGVTLMSAARTTEQVDVVLRAPTSRPPLAAPALAAALGLVCFLLVPVPEDAGVQSRLARAAADSGLAGSGRAAPGAYTGDRVDLRVRGELSDEPLL